MANAPQIDRIPPHNSESEQGVLGCVLLAQDCLNECIERLPMGPEAFYELKHQTLFKALVEMHDAQIKIDIITVNAKLKEDNVLQDAGGMAYVASLPDSIHSAASIKYYLDDVLDKYVQRKLIHTCTSAVGRIYEHLGTTEELLDEVEKDVLNVRGNYKMETGKDIVNLVNQATDTIEKYCESKGALIGIPTGFVDLDKMTRGFVGGQMIVIAARPSVGKTSLAMNIAEHVAVENKISTGVFSLEMTAHELVMRSMCSIARVNLRDVVEGFLAERDFPKLVAATSKLSRAPLHIDDPSSLSILQLKAKARRMKQKHGIKLFIIDYLQLLDATKRTDNRQQEITEISRGIKALAKELDVPIIVLSQLNRELEKRGEDAVPRLSDLRESGAIEQDADFVGLLYKIKVHEDNEHPANMEQVAVPINLLIAKQRNGPTGEVNLTFLKSYTRFESACKVEMG